MKKTLIVVDMQNDFITGPLGTPEARAIVPNVKKKIEAYRMVGDQVIFTMDTHFSDYFATHEGRYLPVEHCHHGTLGWEITPSIEPIPISEPTMLKGTFGGTWWHEDMLMKIFKYRKIELVGVCTDICVISNALILRSLVPYVDIIVDASCCAGTTPEKHKAALEVMKSCHIDIINE